MALQEGSKLRMWAVDLKLQPTASLCSFQVWGHTSPVLPVTCQWQKASCHAVCCIVSCLLAVHLAAKAIAMLDRCMHLCCRWLCSCLALCICLTSPDNRPADV